MKTEDIWRWVKKEWQVALDYYDVIFLVDARRWDSLREMADRSMPALCQSGTYRMEQGRFVFQV